MIFHFQNEGHIIKKIWFTLLPSSTKRKNVNRFNIEHQFDVPQKGGIRITTSTKTK